MPKQITKDTTPAEIIEMAAEYQSLLAKSNVSMKLEQTIADMEKRAADFNNLSVEDWKRGFEVRTASEKAAPKAAKKKPDRGAVTEVDHDYFYVDPQNQAIANTWMK